MNNERVMDTQYQLRCIMAASILRLLAGDRVVGSLLLHWAKLIETAVKEDNCGEIARIRRSMRVIKEDVKGVDMPNALDGVVELLS